MQNIEKWYKIANVLNGQTDVFIHDNTDIVEISCFTFH